MVLTCWAVCGGTDMDMEEWYCKFKIKNMREIKFRGKRIDNGEWVYGFIWGSIDPTKENTEYRAWFIHTGVNIEQSYKVDPKTVGEYTGLKDKNGKEIYEGDIVNIHVFIEELDGATLGVREGEKEMKGEIIYKELGVAIKTGNGDDDWFYILFIEGMIHEESFEIIGNIYETPTADEKI